jgi:hypothetical protein
MPVSAHFKDRQRWHHLGQDHFPIFTSELVFVVVRISDLLYSIVGVIDSPYLGHHTSMSGGSFPLSGDSVVPMSVKQTRPKRRKSDEDVWDWPDAKIIRTYLDPVHVVLISNPVV